MRVDSNGLSGDSMKGMMSLLEKVGLVRHEGDEAGYSPEPSADLGDTASHTARVEEPPAPAAVPLAEATGLSLEQVYAVGNVPPCSYPAERLLRLLDGLKAMDAPLRHQTIAAIDAADDSWTIDDPVNDARAKVAAIEGHASTLRAGIAEAEQSTQAQLAQVRQRQEASTAEIRRQIADLEGLLTREITRGAQESAALESALQAQKDAASRELDGLSRTATELKGLVGQFNPNTSQ